MRGHKNFHLYTLLDPPEYMRITLSAFLEHIIKQYNLREKALSGNFYVDIRRSIYGLPQAGALANKYPKVNLTPHGYFDVPHTPELW